MSSPIWRPPTMLLPDSSRGFAEARWYASYTCANREKQVSEHLRAIDVEHFLPLCEAVHRWKDRRVRLRLPLFPGYVFVRLPLCERLRVLRVPGVVRLVGFNGMPTPLPDREIETLRCGLSHGFCVRAHPYLTVGRRVEIVNGALAGMEGILLRRKGNYHVVLSVNLIRRSLVVEVNAADLMPVRERKIC